MNHRRHHHIRSVLQSTNESPGSGWAIILCAAMLAILAFAAGILYAFSLMGVGK